MELATDAVTTVFMNDREAFFASNLGASDTDVIERTAGLDGFDAAPHGFVATLDQTLSENAGLGTNNEHTARVTVETVLDHCDVNVDDVALL